MQQEIRPLLAVDIIEQLHRQFAMLSGGRGKDGAPIITFPEYTDFTDLPDEDFLNVGAFPGNLQLVLVLRPCRFFQRTIADIGIKLHRDDFKMK
ncbi:hypothetical protein CRUP_021012, partial [Coryphaenoides rupestris]